jgi:hypothetical protein
MDRLSVYRELAEQYDRLGQVSMLDRFLILAADAALEAGQIGEAERMRLRLLQGTRHHMLRPYDSFAEATRSGDVQTYLHDLRTNYPPEIAQQLLDSLHGGEAENTPATSPDQTQGTVDPPSWSEEAIPEPARFIPPTAPLIDLASEQRGAPIAGTSPPLARPMAQPIPARTPEKREGRTARPLQGIPMTQPAIPHVGAAAGPLARRMEALLSPAPLAAPLAPVEERETPPEGGAWFIMMLVGVVCMAGLALLVFTMARPFLPAGWHL